MSRGARTRPSTLVGAWVGNGLVTNLGDYESIATTTVGSGGVAEIDFTSIPSTYKHLQVRALVRTNRASTRDGVYIYINNTRTTTSYTTHVLTGDGATAASGGYDSASGVGAQTVVVLGNSVASQMFAVVVLDILDYANTNKNKTIRAIGGFDYNGGGELGIASNAFLSSTAINRITFDPANGTGFMEYSSFALYGIK